MQPPRLLDTATLEENHGRFVRRAVEHRSVWTVWGHTGPLTADSNSDEETEGTAMRSVYLFFSDEAYACRVLRESWPDCDGYSPREISLFDFLYRWLPGLQQDGHLCGTNWTGDLIGLEMEPSELKAQLDDQLPRELKSQFLELLKSAK